MNRAAEGYSADELRDALHVDVKDLLRRLVHAKRLTRQVVDGRYVYTASAPDRRRQQLGRRRARATVPAVLPGPSATVTASNAQEVKAAIVLFYSLLDERQRRLYAGLESLKYATGAIASWRHGWLSIRTPWRRDAGNCWAPTRSSYPRRRSVGPEAAAQP